MGLSRLAPRAVRPYKRSRDEGEGFYGQRALLWAGALVAVSSSLAFLAVVRSFARFDQAGVEVGHSLKAQSCYYLYADVTSIKHRMTFCAPNGKMVRRPQYILGFADGSSWSTWTFLRHPVPKLDRQIAQLVSRQSGRPIALQP